MPLVKAKSKFDNSTCSLEKDGMKCSNAWTKDQDYLWDTEARKAYCTKHEELNSKVVEGGNKGGFNRGGMPLCRTVDEAIGACQKFNEVIVPMIRQQAKTDIEIKTDTSTNDHLERIEFWTQIYLENFLGKLRNMGPKA